MQIPDPSDSDPVGLGGTLGPSDCRREAQGTVLQDGSREQVGVSVTFTLTL